MVKSPIIIKFYNQQNIKLSFTLTLVEVAIYISIRTKTTKNSNSYFFFQKRITYMIMPSSAASTLTDKSFVDMLSLIKIIGSPTPVILKIQGILPQVISHISHGACQFRFFLKYLLLFFRMNLRLKKVVALEEFTRSFENNKENIR